ncbi:hypothetical protein MPNT_420009 [Candidatus Methylacidithermus pantelleriae]|uniref:Uncharacterized protein n=1 Tax=Candidatus Methylacidithermus pantelleriae TaxID=2744239 RepID=A0A8J2FT44_9BACT|nr:hypothetical protein MPNT_420009 [Candidatus Methylacidithermus pantelleriae]
MASQLPVIKGKRNIARSSRGSTVGAGRKAFRELENGNKEEFKTEPYEGKKPICSHGTL